MGSVDKFLNDLINFDKDNTPLNCVERVERDFLPKETFNPEIRVCRAPPPVCARG